VTGPQQQPGQGSAITKRDGIEAMDPRGPAVLGAAAPSTDSRHAQHEQSATKTGTPTGQCRGHRHSPSTRSRLLAGAGVKGKESMPA